MEKECVNGANCVAKGKSNLKFRDGHNQCWECEKAYRRERQRTSREYYMKKKYAALRQRQSGAGKRRSGAFGKPILTWEEFWQWYLETKDTFEKLFQTYLDSDNNPCLAPSVDRKDSKKGYEIGNLQWLTHSENSSKNNRDPLDYGY